MRCFFKSEVTSVPLLLTGPITHATKQKIITITEYEILLIRNASVKLLNHFLLDGIYTV